MTRFGGPSPRLVHRVIHRPCEHPGVPQETQELVTDSQRLLEQEAATGMGSPTDGRRTMTASTPATRHRTTPRFGLPPGGGRPPVGLDLRLFAPRGPGRGGHRPRDPGPGALRARGAGRAGIGCKPRVRPGPGPAQARDGCAGPGPAVGRRGPGPDPLGGGLLSSPAGGGPVCGPAGEAPTPGAPAGAEAARLAADPGRARSGPGGAGPGPASGGSPGPAPGA